MLAVSDAWKAAHEQTILPEAFVEIKMRVVYDSPNAYVGMSGTMEVFSNIDICNKENVETDTIPALLEENLWVLDGSRTIAPENYQAVGYVGNNTLPCNVNIYFDGEQQGSFPGFTIIWSSEFDSYATNFSVIVGSDTTINVTNNTSNISVVDLPVELNLASGESLRVRIQVHEWSFPNERVRVDGVMFGQVVTFDKSNLISYSHEMSGSPFGTEITKNTIEFSVNNADGHWNVLNPTGMGKHLYERQLLSVRYGLLTGPNIEWINVGKFYLSEWRAPSNSLEATFTARDVIGLMAYTTYKRDSVKGVVLSRTPVYISKEDVLYSTSSESSRVLIAATLAANTEINIYERDYIEVDVSTGEFNVDSNIECYRIDQGWIFSNNVEITSDISFISDANSALQLCLPSGVQVLAAPEIFDYDGPFTVAETTVAEFLQKMAASFGHTVWQHSDGKIYLTTPSTPFPTYVISKDQSYSHPEIELTKPLKQVVIVVHNPQTSSTVDIPYSVNSSGENIIVDCEYLWYSEARLQSISNKYINWWKRREVVSGEFRADPRLELFDTVRVETRYGTLWPVLLTYIKYTYNGMFRATYEGKAIPTNGLETQQEE